MKVLRAHYFDGSSSRKHEVSVLACGAKLKIVGRDVSRELDARAVRRSTRIAGTPQWLYLPDGGACVTEDHETLDRMLRETRFERTLHRWESRPAFAALAVALVVGAMYLLVDRGVPAAAEAIAERIPVEAEAALGREALAGMDRYFMKPSKLAPGRQEALRAKLAQMSAAAGVTVRYRLEFRASPVVGANAFALPSGIIVMTDELVKRARNDQEVLGVLAHELGHQHHRHIMRSLLESSAIALIIAGVTGDVASATSLAAAAPTLLLHAKYSRENEREADRYAIETMRKAGLEPRYFGTLLARLEGGRKRRSGVPDFLASHPATEERAALAGLAPADVAETDAEQQAELVAEKRKLVALDPVQREVLALLERRDFAALDQLLGAQQLAFERDAGDSAKLENAFRAFGKLQRSAEPALDEWVRKSPSSYAARVARASYYLSQGLDARGTDFIGETAEEDLDTMRAYFDKARADLEHSVGLSAKPYLSHLYLMIANCYCRGKGDVHYEAAVKLAPQSVELRLQRMTELEPRWGGSVEKMEDFAAQARKELADPAAANRVAARVPAYRAFEQRRAKDMAGALKYLDEAIALDADSSMLCERSYVLMELKREAEAFADTRRGLSKARESRYCMERAVFHAGRLKDAGEAIEVLDLVLEVDPRSAPALNQRGWRHQTANRQDAAFRDYLASAEAGDAWGQLMAGKSYWAGMGTAKDPDRALEWLRKSADQGNRDAKVSLQQALELVAKQGR